MATSAAGTSPGVPQRPIAAPMTSMSASTCWRRWAVRAPIASGLRTAYNPELRPQRHEVGNAAGGSLQQPGQRFDGIVRIEELGHRGDTALAPGRHQLKEQPFLAGEVGVQGADRVAR